MQRLVLRQGVGVVAGALVVGVGVAALVTRFLRTMLIGVSPLDAVTFVAGSVLFAGAALLATYLPARRATRVDPAVTLRAE